MKPTLLCILAFTTSLAAQITVADDLRQDLNSGLGRVTFGPLLLASLTGQGSNLGVAWLNDEIYISARGNSGGGTGPHTCTVLDRQGNVVRSFLQLGSAASVWGWRDGDSDRFGTLVFGYENAIEFVDANGNPVTSIVAANGFQTVASSTVPQFTGTALAVIRALAYDWFGNGGNGSLWVADFGSALVELNLNGVEIRRIPFNGTWSLYGLALHPYTRRLWGNSSPNSADGTPGKIVEIDLTTGLETGAKFDHLPGAQGGLDVVIGGLDGRNRGVDLLSLTQTQTLMGHRIDLYDGVDGTNDVELKVSTDGVNPSVARVLASNPTRTRWSLDLDDGSATPRPLDIAAFAINIPVFAAVDPILDPLLAGLLPSLAEVRYQDAFTQPSGVALYVSTTEAAPRLDLSMASIRSPTLTAHGDFLRAQGIYADLAVPPAFGPQIMFTNQSKLWIEKNPTFGITVAANGTNPFNATTTSGFWSVTNNGPFEILQVTFVLPTGNFDEDEPNMADVFWGGNSTVVGCRGTYRLGCDLICDLDYSLTAAAGCDATARKGYLFPQGSTLVFNFRDATGPNGGFRMGEKFEFDCDTDGITPLSGAGHAGTAVTLRVFDRTTATTYVGWRSLVVTGVANESAASF